MKVIYLTSGCLADLQKQVNEHTKIGYHLAGTIVPYVVHDHGITYNMFLQTVTILEDY